MDIIEAPPYHTWRLCHFSSKDYNVGFWRNTYSDISIEPWVYWIRDEDAPIGVTQSYYYSNSIYNKLPFLDLK